MNLIALLNNKFGGKKGFVKYCYFYCLQLIFRRYSKYSMLPKQIKRVVFVCKGNVCRSAAAEWMFKLKSSLPCCSVGVDTRTGFEANERVAIIAKTIDVDLSQHLTTSIKDFTKSDGDVYVCMEPEHIDKLRNAIGECEILLLGSFGEKGCVYIHDPYSANTYYMKKCVLTIQESVIKLIASIDAGYYRNDRRS